MKNAIKNYWANNDTRVLFFEFSTFFFVATLPLWEKLNTLALWFFVAASIFLLKPKERLENIKKHKTTFYLLVSLYLLFVIGVLLSENTNDALKDMERTLTLVLIPLIVLSHSRNDFSFKKIYISLGIGLSVGMLICWVAVIESILTNATPWVQAKYFFQWIYNGWNLMKPLDGHPSYFAVLLVIFVLGVVRDPSFANFRKNKARIIFFLAPFFLFLIETSSRIGVVCLILVLLITIFKKLELKSIFYAVALLVLVALLSIRFDYLGSKFAEIIDSEGNITSERYQRWDQIIPVFNSEGNWLWGVGTGDAQALLDKAYIQGDYSLALVNDYNSHNQYLEFLVSNGLIGFIVFIMVLACFYKKTKLKGEALSFFIIITLFSFIETIFGRSQGVFIFSFFYAIFILWYSSESHYAK